MNHLPALQIVLPLLSAPVCVLLGRKNWARVLASAVCVISLAISWALYRTVQSEGPLAYHIGGWKPPWGIELRADSLTVLLLLLVTSIATLVVFTGIGKNSHSVPKGREAFFYAAYLLSMTGLLGMTLTGDAFNVFVFLEISSLSTYTLIALGKGRRALTAALSYLMIGTVGGTFILLGIGFLYQLTGTLNMADLAQRLGDVRQSRTLLLAFSFLMVGIGLKVAVFPIYQWLPNAYAFAPSSVSAFVAGTATKVIYYLMIRFIFTVFGAAFVFGALDFKSILLPLSLVAMFGGSIAAIYQTDFKRLLAYSSIAQLGYLTLALSLGTEEGVSAGLIHVFNHAVTKAGLFLVAAAIVARIGSAKIQDMAGLAKKMPMTMAALVVGGLGLIGVPGTAGFISKWYLVLAAIESGDLYVALLILLSSLLAVAYVWRLIEVVYFRTPAPTPTASEQQAGQDLPPPPPAEQDEEPPGVLIPAWTLMAASLYFGFFADWPVELAQDAANGLWATTNAPVAEIVRGGQ